MMHGSNGSQQKKIYSLTSLTRSIKKKLIAQAKLPSGAQFKPFGVPHLSGAFRLWGDHKAFLQARFNKPDLVGKDFVDGLAQHIGYYAAEEKSTLDLTTEKALTVAAEYVIGALKIEPENIMPFADYAKIVVGKLRPAYKAINEAGELVTKTAFDGVYTGTIKVEGKPLSKMAINEAALEGYRTIQKFTDPAQFPHLAVFRNNLNRVFPIFSDEKAWNELRAVEGSDRPSVINMLKRDIHANGNPIVNVGMVQEAVSIVLSNKDLPDGVASGVSMKTWLEDTRHSLGDHVKAATENKVTFANFDAEQLGALLKGMNGYVPEFSLVANPDGTMMLTATIRDNLEEAAVAIPTRINMGKVRTHAAQAYAQA